MSERAACASGDVIVASPRRRLLLLMPSLALAIFAAFQIAHYTGHGLVTNSDSASYIGMADNIRHGHGPTLPFTSVWDKASPSEALRFHGVVPSSHFPPGYPTALAAFSVANSVRGAARLINVMCAALNIVLIGWLTARMTKYRSVIVATLPPAMMLFVADTRPFALEAGGWFPSHEVLASEPIFAVLLTAATLAGGAAIYARGRRGRLALAAAALLAGGALLTRYVGISVVVALTAALFLFDNVRPRRTRARRATIFAVVALAPTFVYAVADAMIGGGGANVVSYHPDGGFTSSTLRILGSMLLPITWSDAWLVALVVVFGGIAGYAAVWLPKVSARWRDDLEGLVLLRVSLLIVVAYIGMLWFSQAFVDAHIAIQPRHFVGLRGIWTAAVVAACYRVGSAYVRQAVAAIALVIVFGLVSYADWAPATFWWRRVPAFPITSVDRVVRALPRNALIVTNAPDAVYLRTGRASLVLPSRQVFLTGETNRSYARDVSAFAQILNEHGGYVFYTFTDLPVAGIGELSRHANLRLIANDRSEALYVDTRPR